MSSKGTWRRANSKTKSSATISRRPGNNSLTPLPGTPDNDNDTPAIPEVVDEHIDLRYQEKVHFSLSGTDLVYPTRTVFVRRRLQTGTTPQQPAPPKTSLLLPGQSAPDDEPLQVYNAATSMLHRRTEAIENEVAKNRCSEDLRRKAMAAQEASLNRWEETLDVRDKLKLNMATKTNRTVQGLVMNRTLPLPPIQNHRELPSLGPESDFPQWRQTERSYRDDAFFLLPDRVGPEDQSLVLSLKWSERKFYKPPVAMVRPLLGEESPFQGEREKTRKVPKTEGDLMQLNVTSRAHVSTAAAAEEDDKFEQKSPLDVSQAAEEVCGSHSMNRGSRGSKLFTCEPCGVRMDSPYYVRKTVPALQLDRFTYVWGQPCLQGVVEIGVVSNAGEPGLTYIQMANVGCCVMRYSWRRLPHVDHFNTGRYRLSPFVFNSSDGSLLPEEKLSIAVEFRSRFAGCWTERWLLKTTPCVYRGARGRTEISVSLWGKALEVDVNLDKRQTMDRDLDRSAVLRMAQRCAGDLVRLLPIRTAEQRAESALRRCLRLAAVKASIKTPPPSTAALAPKEDEEDTVAVFTRLNPSLHYHSAAMLGLQSARYDLHVETRALLALCEATSSPRLSMSMPATMERQGSKKSMRAESVDRGIYGFRQERSAREGRLSAKLPSINGSHQSRSRRKLSIGRQSKTTSSLQGSGGCTSGVSLSEEEIRQLRRQVKVAQVCREAYFLSEESEKKEEILQSVNQAILLMSPKPFTPSMKHHKHILVRAALVQMFDKLASLEWDLRYRLHLLDDPRFQRLATFPENASKIAEPKKRGSPNDRPNSNKKISNVKKQIKSSEFQEEEEEWELLLELQSIHWGEPMAQQYKEKLWTLVYGLLGSTLESLLPIVMIDGYNLNLLRPRSPR